jgi:hypothetical protein
MSDWGKGVNNNIGWGQGANNDIGWGSIYDKSNAGETLLKSDLNIDAFIIEVDTTKAGTPSDQFQFTGALGDYDVIAKQNDIVVATFDNLSGEQTITLPSSGVYDLEISAKEVNGFNKIRYNRSGDRFKILDIKQWGNIVWSTFNGSFRDCSNLLVTANDVPNLSQALLLDSMFVRILGNPNVAEWDVTSVEDFDFMFFGSVNANPNLRNWNIINAHTMAAMFNDKNLSVENLTACYENWSQLSLQQNVSFSAGSTKYNSSGQAGRDILVNTYNWIIEDGGQV